MFNLPTINNTPWMIEPTRGESMVRMLPQMLAAGFPTQTEIDARQEAAAKRLQKVSGKLAIIRIHGVIEHRASLWSYYFGGFSCEMGGRVLDEYLARKDIDAILLDIDSPGGTVSGVEEFAEKIYEGRAKKPIYAIANSDAYSAAYWIGTAATDLAVTPSGGAGSLGVYILHAEYSKMLEAEGLTVNFIRKPVYKADANPYEALTDAAREHLQKIVDDTYDKFVAAVAKYRGKQRSEVKEKFGQGRIVMAADALAAGMVDRVISFDGLMGKLLGSTDTQPGRSRASVDVLRKRAEAAKRKVSA